MRMIVLQYQKACNNEICQIKQNGHAFCCRIIPAYLPVIILKLIC